ncbi:MAG: hypothetical protein IJM49_01185 [Firmicutes bacterium]|nr:hypothetical protein [Bacillota bacterium]
MTRPVNIFALSRIRGEDDFNIIKKHISRHDDKRRTQYHEMESLRFLVDALIDRGVSVSELDGFFFGYSISRIGKEFDLLKVTDKYCLNIELKSMNVPESQVLEQLRRNRYYLNLLGKRQELYTVITDSLKCYKLSLGGELAVSDLSEVAGAVRRASEAYIEEIDSLFRPSNYLVSPMNTPERFIQKEYFLTQAQDVIKRELMSSAEKAFSGYFYHLTGRPGTGKTLLLYDIAGSFAKNGRALIIHCGQLCPGQMKISEEVENLQIVSSGELGKELLDDVHFILVDESQRLSPELFGEIVEAAAANGQICVFSSDPQQVLTLEERENDIAGKIRVLEPLTEFRLSERIRTNREIYSFILRMMHLKYVRGSYDDYSDIRLDYANTTAEAQMLLEYYRKEGYTFIGLKREDEDLSNAFEQDIYAGDVIGQEFGNVVMILDDDFYYDEEGRLRGVQTPGQTYLYTNLLYQGITRVRDKLALIVLRNEEVFSAMARIFGDPGSEDISSEEELKDTD